MRTRSADVSEADRARLHLTMGPMEFDWDTVVGMRLNEHLVHEWDVAVALDSSATLADDGSPILLLDPSGIAKRAGITLAESELHQVLRGAEEETEAERETSLLLFRTCTGGRRAVPAAIIAFGSLARHGQRGARPSG